MLLGDHRVAELVGLVVVLDDRARQRRALLDAEALGERAGGDVAHHHLERDDLDLADQLLAHVEAADEVGRHADLGQPHHQVFGDAVVEHALAGDDALLLVVEGGGVVLEVLDQRAGLGPLEQDLGLAFVDLPAAAHATVHGGIPRGSVGRRHRAPSIAQAGGEHNRTRARAYHVMRKGPRCAARSAARPRAPARAGPSVRLALRRARPDGSAPAVGKFAVMHRRIDGERRRG